MHILTSVTTPRDVQALDPADLPVLAQEIREHLIAAVTATGGHLGPNLGVVELTIALHRVFTSPHDALIFDTGHQSYVHKLLTGRHDFSALRQEGGLSGYPSRSESVHDIVENSHATTAISWADGIALGRALDGHTGAVVAVIGDGALTGGMAWEALNNVIASRRRVIVVVNDNERSYSPTIGGLVPHLAVLGAQYVGPIDGHDIAALEAVFADCARATSPVIVHVKTDKGRGYDLALADDAERFHGIGPIDATTGAALKPAARTWTQVFSQALVAAGHSHEDLVAITAAMPGPTGLDKFAATFPDRFVDVGIAEQHAATMAAGLAFAGKHPVVALYSTFLNRAFDQVLMDCGLHRAGVTFVLDRAGVTGDDGASHNGIWDMALMRIVPGLAVAAPRDETQLQELLSEALDVRDAPTVLRFPKGAVEPSWRALRREDGMDVLYSSGKDVLIVSVGPFARMSMLIAAQLSHNGISATVIDPRWVLPVNEALVRIAPDYGRVVVIEDGTADGGVGDALASAMSRDVMRCAVPGEYYTHASRQSVLSRAGLTADAIVQKVRQAVWQDQQVQTAFH